MSDGKVPTDVTNHLQCKVQAYYVDCQAYIREATRHLGWHAMLHLLKTMRKQFRIQVLPQVER